MSDDRVKYQVEKAIASLRLALEYGSKDLNAYELGNITEAMKSLDCLNFTMRVTNLMKKSEEDEMWNELKQRTVAGPAGFKFHATAQFVPAQDTDGL
jgi:hypothetical protein